MRFGPCRDCAGTQRAQPCSELNHETGLRLIHLFYFIYFLSQISSLIQLSQHNWGGWDVSVPYVTIGAEDWRLLNHSPSGFWMPLWVQPLNTLSWLLENCPNYLACVLKCCTSLAFCEWEVQMAKCLVQLYVHMLLKQTTLCLYVNTFRLFRHRS